MLANFFGKSKPVNFIVLFALFLSYFSFSLVTKEVSLETAKEIIGILLIFSVFNFIITKNKLTFDNSYAFLFFVLLLGFFPEAIHLDKTFLVAFSILLFSRKIYSLQSSKNSLFKLFDGGLWLGVSFLIEPYSLLFAVLLYTAIYLHEHFTYQTLLTPFIGFISVVFLFFTYCFWYNEMPLFYQLFDWNLSYNIDFYLTTKHLFSILFIAVLVFYALILKTPKALSVLNTFRKNWILTCIHLFIALITALLIPHKTGTELLFLFFPIAIILANGIELFQKSWISDAVLLLFFSCSIVANFL
ncbi:DUF6427 family protein [Tenacibaculum finnmarkense]|uniref:DUF6427 family protein n=1 Tax=Tenacibaculum finnmarkense TaxID=2781243 RepID=UPI001E544DFC|nr:DUF6427 family protein [Tenacibaculum finnmarkense]MCD8402344.1 DUF6427 family protein [Tenacibaculum finnmarkense genomovar finnmarkense]MCG8206524.1 hypothetical protein [Tenacibaculum finnmarkense genomovar finnmarkense]MCG8722568.1 hypothetical protein [Tenacibaculum finnmarkense]MCG8740892.1 hypothetical protein [Tenacibaculum finnmarkense]MCG8764217.1 hypothetical protein [Tenacibaculum finnmarkense]